MNILLMSVAGWQRNLLGRNFVSFSLIFDRLRGIDWIAGPDEEFPGKQPPSAAEMLEFNSSQVYQDHAYGGRGGSRGRGRRNMMSPIRGRGYFCGRARESYGGDGRAERQLSFGSFNHHEQPSSLEQEGELVSLHDNTSTSQDQSSLIIDDTPDTQLSDGGRQDFIASTIVCRQCGVTGHPELHCPYQITIKQGLDRERHLVCHTPGHKAFRFNSYHGCLGCKKGSEQRASEKPEPTVVPSINIEDGGTSVAGVHEAACGSGWEETDYNNAIQRSALGSPDELVQVITSGIEAHNLETHTEVKFEKDGKDSRDDGDDEQVLIRF